MKERGILFSAPMVKAILADTKTQTRRLMNPQPEIQEPGGRWSWHCDTENEWGYTVPNDDGFTFRRASKPELIRCPFADGDPKHCSVVRRDRLWVRETWRPTIAHSHGEDACDCADVNIQYLADKENAAPRF